MPGEAEGFKPDLDRAKQRSPGRSTGPLHEPFEVASALLVVGARVCYLA